MNWIFTVSFILKSKNPIFIILA